MANQDAPFGLRPSRSSISANTQNRYRIANNYGTAIFQGDLVAMVTGGGIERVAAGGSGLILGVFNGCQYTDPTSGKPTWSAYYPGSVAADDIFPVADLAGNYDIVATAGDTTSGRSNLELEVGTADSTVATLPLKAIDISQDPENSDTSSANTNVIVKINNHLFSAGTAGLA